MTRGVAALQRQKEIVKISVGAQAVNELLGGGIESRCITEFYGEFRWAHGSDPCPALLQVVASNFHPSASLTSAAPTLPERPACIVALPPHVLHIGALSPHICLRSSAQCCLEHLAHSHCACGVIAAVHICCRQILRALCKLCSA